MPSAVSGSTVAAALVGAAALAALALASGQASAASPGVAPGAGGSGSGSWNPATAEPGPPSSLPGLANALEAWAYVRGTRDGISQTRIEDAVAVLRGAALSGDPTRISDAIKSSVSLYLSKSFILGIQASMPPVYETIAAQADVRSSWPWLAEVYLPQLAAYERAAKIEREQERRAEEEARRQAAAQGVRGGTAFLGGLLSLIPGAGPIVGPMVAGIGQGVAGGLSAGSSGPSFMELQSAFMAANRQGQN
jgi:hypothetical protein